jgi:hypothetical protein
MEVVTPIQGQEVCFVGGVAGIHPGDMPELSPPRSREIEGCSYLFYAVGRASFPAYEGVYLDPTEATQKATSPTGQIKRFFRIRMGQRDGYRSNIQSITTCCDSPGTITSSITSDMGEDPE